MRHGVDGLPSRHPLSGILPSLMQEDDLTMRWVTGLDEVLAPLMWTIDSLEAYFDPLVAPMDFVEWLGGWVGAAAVEGADETTRRALVAETAELYGRRGTVAGLRRFLELTSGVEVVGVDDGGSVAWTQDPTKPLNGGPGGRPALIVEIRGDDADVKRVTALVGAWSPAHVAVRVEAVST